MQCHVLPFIVIIPDYVRSVVFRKGVFIWMKFTSFVDILIQYLFVKNGKVLLYLFDIFFPVYQSGFIVRRLYDILCFSLTKAPKYGPVPTQAELIVTFVTHVPWSWTKCNFSKAKHFLSWNFYSPNFQVQVGWQQDLYLELD